MSDVLIIAEVGVNHNGDVGRALDMIDVGAEAGADVVKFQTFRADALATRLAAKASYQKRTTGTGESQHDMLRALEIDPATHELLRDRCRERGVEFLSTPFDAESLHLLVDRLDVRRIKLGSGELTNAPLLLEAAQSGKPLILSTGMSTLDEVAGALGVLAFGYQRVAHGFSTNGSGGTPPSRDAFAEAWALPAARAHLVGAVTLLHCTTEYPTPHSDVNLRAMQTMSEQFGLPVGYSDHTVGIPISVAATALGATVIEKHFTLDRGLPGPDHAASIQPEELAELVAGVRAVEAARGDGIKRPAPSEVPNIDIARKSLVASCTIAAGEPFTEHNLTVKRPGTGRSPFDYWDVLGTPAERDYDQDEFIA